MARIPVDVFLLPKSSFGKDAFEFVCCESESESLSNWAIMALIFWPGVRMLGELLAGDKEPVDRAVRGVEVVDILGW
jgi:hypothetical protein